MDPVLPFPAIMHDTSHTHHGTFPPRVATPTQVMEMVRPRAAKRGLETPLELWGFFVEACRRNLHICLCFSPIGDAFRERLRANPSIVNCCTIDWCALLRPTPPRRATTG